MKHRLQFAKWQGCGNDFILVDELRTVTPDDVRSKMATILCDRHFGIGADGIIFVEDAEGADGAMRLFEPAGNEADMCGNGLRCVAAFLCERTGKSEVDVATKDGVKQVLCSDGEYTVDMGKVRTTRAGLAGYVTDKGSPDDSMLQFDPFDDGEFADASILNTGEPHIVVFVEDIASKDVVGIGESLNSDRQRYPKGVNINFVQVVGPNEIAVRTYERGVYDETMACGTGATAGAAASLMRGLTVAGPITVSTRGGKLRIELLSDGRATMSGPARRVFSGEIELDI